MKAFSFVHAADLHLGYSQYGLEARREDFDRAFQELIERTIELKPDFMIIAGDLFHHARPSNVTLENAIKGFNRLREAKIPVLAVDGSHDSAPNVVTGTILNPLDSAGLICYLPRRDGAYWVKHGSCYVYGVPNFRTKGRTEEMLPKFMERNKPAPDPSIFNIFVFHMTLDIPSVKPPYVEAEASPDLVPDGFDYYAAGHVHAPHKEAFKTGLLVYSGCTETVNYDEADVKKGFYYVEVSGKGDFSAELVELESPRKFTVLERDFTGLTPSKITEIAVQLVKSADDDGVVLVPVLKGALPAEASCAEVDVAQIRAAAKRALFVHPIILLRESGVSEEAVRLIFESGFKDLRVKAFEYFLQIFSERYGHDEAKMVARAAVDLIEPLTKRHAEKVRQTLEGLVR